MTHDQMLELRTALARWLLKYLPNARACGEVQAECEEVILNYLRILNDMKRKPIDEYSNRDHERARIFEESEKIFKAAFGPEASDRTGD